jgi:hypothetical protein
VNHAFRHLRHVGTDRSHPSNVRPHGIILTEKTVPSPIFVAAMIGVEKLLRIDLDATQGR